MQLGELIEKLERVVSETDAVYANELQGVRRRVLIQAQNRDEFVWLEAELVSVEQHTGAPDVVLVCRVTSEQEAAIFTRLDPEEDPLEVESTGVRDSGWVDVDLGEEGTLP